MGDEWNISALLGEGCTPIGFVAAVKYLNEEGDITLATVSSSEISYWERLGMHLTAVEDVKRSLNEPEDCDD